MVRNTNNNEDIAKMLDIVIWLTILTRLEHKKVATYNYEMTQIECGRLKRL
jgi:hypothetical protein